MLQKEYTYYKSHQDELNKKYPGKFLGIVGEQVVGTYSSELEAYSDLKKKFGPGKFLIQESVSGSNNIQRYHTRVAFS